MKRVQRYVALAVSALMLSPLVPADVNKVYAEEKYVDGVHYIDAEDTDEDFVEEENSAVDYKALEDIPMGIVGDLSTSQFSLDNSLEENVLDSEDSMESVDSDALDEELEIMTDDIASINDSSSTVYIYNYGTTTNSIRVHWTDPDYATTDYKVVAKAKKSIKPNYGGVDTHYIDVSKSNEVTITNLVPNMQYEISLYVGTTKLASITPSTRPDFAIIVGNSLYSDSTIKASLDTYVQDLRYKEGIGAEILPIVKGQSAVGAYRRDTPASLKSLISNRYSNGNGIKGFVIIGSSEDIPTAKVERQSDGNDKWVSDLYYADMDGTWTDSDNDGFFEDPTSDSDKYIPELYYGRIDPKGVVTSKADEISYINNYLARIHAYRENGNKNLNDMVRKRACVFNDAQFSGYQSPSKSYSKLFVNTYNMTDQNETTADKLVDVLKLGYGMINLMVHSSNTLHQVWTIDDSTGQRSYENLTLSNLESRLGSTDPMFNYMNMYCCSGCKFEDNNGNPTTNLGAYYLFRSGTGLNITGATTSAGILTNESFYNKLGNGSSIGEAFLEFFRTNTIFKNLHSTFVLLGDPTLKYGFTKAESAAPYITSNLTGTFNSTEGHYLQATAGTPFKIYVSDTDSSYSDIDYLITGSRPAGTTITKTNNYISINVPTASTCYFDLSLFNKDSSGHVMNAYTQKFHVTVK